MPTYQYTCSQCGHEMEVSQKITADPLKVCPQCSHSSLQRGIGGGSATLRFVGSGFYITDYRQAEGSSSNPCPCGKPTSCSKDN